MKPQHINDNITFPIPAQERPKLSGMEFYTKTLGAPKLVVRFTIILCRQFLFLFFIIAFCVLRWIKTLMLTQFIGFYLLERRFIFQRNQ